MLYFVAWRSDEAKIRIIFVRQGASVKEFLAATKALADENRLRALAALSGGELCLCHIIRLLGLAPSTVSKHMTILYHAGLVDVRKSGKWIYYRLIDKSSSKCSPRLLAAAMDCLRCYPEIRADAIELKRIRKMSLQELCCRYRKSVRKK